MSGAELKPCPFCGAEAHMLGGPMSQDAYSAWCKAKGRRHHVNGTMDANQTAAIWNTRADLPPTIAAALALPEIAALVDACSRVGPLQIAGHLRVLKSNGPAIYGIWLDEAIAVMIALAALEAAKARPAN